MLSYSHSVQRTLNKLFPPRIWNLWPRFWQSNVNELPRLGICFKKVPFIKIKALQIKPSLYLTTFPHSSPSPTPSGISLTLDSVLSVLTSCHFFLLSCKENFFQSNCFYCLFYQDISCPVFNPCKVLAYINPRPHFKKHPFSCWGAVSCNLYLYGYGGMLDFLIFIPTLCVLSLTFDLSQSLDYKGSVRQH